MIDWDVPWKRKADEGTEIGPVETGLLKLLKKRTFHEGVNIRPPKKNVGLRTGSGCESNEKRRESYLVIAADYFSDHEKGERFYRRRSSVWGLTLKLDLKDPHPLIYVERKFSSWQLERSFMHRLTLFQNWALLKVLSLYPLLRFPSI